MLYDPKWEKTKTKADPSSLQDLIAWLETKPADDTYDWNNCQGSCLFGLYFSQACGLVWWGEGDERGSDAYLRHVGTKQVEIAHTRPWTFGAALERARKLAA